MKYNIEDTIDFYISSKNTNDFVIKNIKEYKYYILKVYLLNKFRNVVDEDLLIESLNNTLIYLEELKNDRYYLKVIKKLIDKSYKVGINEFEEDLLSIIVCIEIKDKHIKKLEDYYIEKITCQIKNFGYQGLLEKNRIDEYNNKIETLFLKLSNNSLDNNN